MSDQMTNRTSELLKQSVLRMQAMRKRLEEVSQTDREPIAVVGMACRFPGGCDTPERYWEFLSGGGVGVRDVPADRWSMDEYYDPARGKHGKMYIRQSNFLDRDVAAFDARFFRISPVEANAMDPQQRQLLEVCWEALENAGQRPDELRGSDTGVFVGVASNSEYGALVEDSADVNEYIGTGTTSSVASGRIAYVFGLNGPALSLDTACSSSLVSIKLAADALRRKDCGMAIAGGVSMMLAPTVMASLCAMNALAPDGRSKPFDASADGYGRGEGCGIVVLKRLRDAQRDNDTIYAVIHGGAVNNDGESSGLTIPNGRAQKNVLEAALRNAGLAPEAVDYLETHGTGTLLGDPIEVDAINQVYGRDRDRPLVLSAVKGNIGHLENAAGVASLIKAVLSLYHGTIPPVTGLVELNPRIAPMSGALTFPTSTHPWPAQPGHARYAGVSSFGFSGTNAHLILGEAPDTVADPPGRDDTELLILSATTEKKLVQLIRDHRDHLAGHPDVALSDVCYSANSCRPAFPHRATFVGRTTAELQESLGSVLHTYDEKGTLYLDTSVILGSSSGSDRYNAKRGLFTALADGTAYAARSDEEIKPKLAFVFDGDGGDVFRIARELHGRFPVFREALVRCLTLFGDEYASQVPALLAADGEPGDARVRQAWLFATEYAINSLFESYGVVPQITFGERTGGLIAAVVAGVLSLEAAVRQCVALFAVQASIDVVAVRVVLDSPTARETVESVVREVDGVHLVATYSPGEYVISGPGTATAAATAALTMAGAVVSPANGFWPSPAYAAVSDRWHEAADREKYQRPGKRFQSAQSLQTAHQPAIIRDEFRDTVLTDPIRYAEGLERLYEQGYRFFVEIGTSRPMERTAGTPLDRDDVVVIRLTDEAAVLPALLHGLAKLICLGSSLTWAGHYAGRGLKKIMLPNYPFELSRHWLAKADPARADGLQARLAGRLDRHGLDGEALNLPTRQEQYVYTFTHRNFPDLAHNSGVVHVGHYLEMLKAVVDQRADGRSCLVRDMRFHAPIVVFGEEIKEVLLLLDGREDEGWTFQFHSKNAEATGWTLHVQGTVAVEEPVPDAVPLDVEALRASSERRVTGEEFYESLEGLGFAFGPAVRWVSEAWPATEAALVRFDAPDGLPSGRQDRLGFHPGVLDSCAQVCNYVTIGRTGDGKKFMVSEVDGVLLAPGVPGGELYAHVLMPEYDQDRQEIIGRVQLVDGAGRTVAAIERIRLKEFDESKIAELKVLMDAAAMDRGRADRDFLQQYGAAGPQAKQTMLLEYVTQMLAAILEMDPADIDPGEPMRNLGLDSMTGLRFFNKTNQMLSIDIQFADVIQSDDLHDLTNRLADLLPGGSGRRQAEQAKPYDTNLSAEHWIYRHRPARPEARVRLFCFPNGFRNADLFDEWHDLLGPEVDVCAIVLPGIDTLRMDETPPTDLDEFMWTLEQVLAPEMLDLPCATFGHSWGSLFSYRLGYRLSLNPKANVVKTFVSGFAAPTVVNPSIVKLLDELGKQGMTRIPTFDEIQGDQETVSTVVKAYQVGWGYGEDQARLALPQLLTACSLIDRYTQDRSERFGVAVTAFHGVDDWVASEEVKLWEDLTSGPFALHTLAGDHQFISGSQSEERLIKLIRTDLLSAVTPA